MRSTRDARWNGCTPVNISNSTAPSEKMSVRGSIGAPVTCSGDMYPAVPRTPEVLSSVVSSSGPAPGSLSRSLARPKSSSFTRPSRVTNAFSGFTSRWTIPFSWAAPSASAIWMPYSTALRKGRAPPPQALAQRLALEQLGDDVGHVAVGRHVEHGDDVRVVEAAGRARLAAERLHALLRQGEGRAQHLDGHVTAEARVARAVHLAHAPAADAREDLVGSEAMAGREHAGGLLRATGPQGTAGRDRGEYTPGRSRSRRVSGPRRGEAEQRRPRRGSRRPARPASPRGAGSPPAAPAGGPGRSRTR